jgi:hypothetical protein
MPVRSTPSGHAPFAAKHFADFAVIIIITIINQSLKGRTEPSVPTVMMGVTCIRGLFDGAAERALSSAARGNKKDRRRVD